MQTLQISPQKAFSLYPDASKEFKTMLEESFGKEFFSQKITERIKTFEDAAAIVGVTENQQILLSYNGIDADMIAAVAFLKLTIIARALNEGWQSDWSNNSQYKYAPWFEHKAGFGLSYSVYGDWLSYSVVGSRLCYKSSELAKYAAIQFADLYNDFLSIK